MIKIPLPFRTWLLNREADKLLRKAGQRPRKPSLHLVRTEPRPAHQLPDYTRRPWFVILALWAAFSAGYIAADDNAHEAATACEQSGARP